MIRKTLHNLKSILVCLFAFAFALFLFSTCMSVDDEISESTIPQLSLIDEGEIEFESNAAQKTFEVNSNTPWSIIKKSETDWINITPTKGKKGITELTVSVKENSALSRKGTFKIIASNIEKTITITQEAADFPEINYTSIEALRTMYAESGRDEWIVDESITIKGVVISDRVGSNRSSQRDGYIQDEDGHGISFRVKQSDHAFDLGDELSINLEDARILIYGGVLQLNFSSKLADVLDKDVEVSPYKLSIEQVLNDEFDGTLVKIEEVQFKEYEKLNFWDKGNATNRFIENSDGDSIIVRTTKKANFKNETLPAGSGNLVGIASYNNDDDAWHLFVRNIEDTEEMSNDASTRFAYEDEPIEATRVKIADLRSSIGNGEIYAENSYIEGEVLLNAHRNNVPSEYVYIADETAGITLTFSDKENILSNVPMGAKVKVNIKDARVKVFEGLLQIGDANTLTTHAVDIIEKSATSPITPKVATIAEVMAGKYQSELVKIDNVQFKNTETIYADNVFIENEAGEALQVYTRKEAAFANKLVKEGRGSFIGVVGMYNTPHILIRSIDELANMNDSRFSEEGDEPTASFIRLSKNSLTLSHNAFKETIVINSNVDWRAEVDEMWLTVSSDKEGANGSITVTANENIGDERKATITITDGTISRTVQVTQKGIEKEESVATDLFFSEYVKGSSYNKYLEIYNGTGKAVDLSDYQIEVYINGQTTPKYTQQLFETLENREVVVLKHPKSFIYFSEAIESSALNFNGNDAIALVKISTDEYVDIIGCIGENPGKGWIDPKDKDLSTLDKTLVRKPSVRKGVTENPTSGFPTLGSEWISYPVDTADKLGWHSVN